LQNLTYSPEGGQRQIEIERPVPQIATIDRKHWTTAQITKDKELEVRSCIVFAAVAMLQE
jgi:hypothetical protein